MSANLLPLITQRLSRPLFIMPSLADSLYSIVEGRLTINGASLQAVAPAPTPEASRFVGSFKREDGSRRLTRVVGSTAVITIDGSLVNRGAWLDANMCTGMVSYEGIAAQLADAVADPAVKSILLDINSGGGEANGMADLAAKIRAAKAKKNVVAVVNDVAASAAYGIAASATEVVVSPTSITGSIGVVMLHLDRSAELAAAGVRPTLIYAGEHKVDGHPFGPLPESVRADMQREVMAFYDLFLGVVEQGRGKGRLNAKKARDTQARTYIGAEAVTLGLADRVASFEQVLADLSRPTSRAKPQPSKGSKAMTPESEDNNTPAPAATLDVNALATATATAVLSALQASGVLPGVQAQAPANQPAQTVTVDPVKAERDRVAAISALPEAKGREALAMSLASAGMTADQAKLALAAAPLAVSTPAPDQRGNGPEFGLAIAPPANPEAALAMMKGAFARSNARIPR